MERLFGTDLADVGVSTDRSLELNAIGAVAAAMPNHIAFADAAPARRVVAHEVAHVLQFRRLDADGRHALPRVNSRRDTPAEREAAAAAEKVARGLPVVIRERPAAAIHRLQPDDLAPGEEPRRQGIKEEDVPVTAIEPANEKHARRVRAVVAQMTRSSDIVTRNTAHRVIDGDIMVRLIEDLPPHPDPEAVLTAGGVAPGEVKSVLRNGVVYEVPGANAPKYISNTANNFYSQEIVNTVFIRGRAEAPQIELGLEHEANHALNPDWSTPEEQFDTEARAYYVAEMRRSGGTDVNELIRFARENALRNYPALNALYESDLASPFRRYVDTWKPTGNLTNAPEEPTSAP